MLWDALNHYFTIVFSSSLPLIYVLVALSRSLSLSASFLIFCTLETATIAFNAKQTILYFDFHWNAMDSFATATINQCIVICTPKWSTQNGFINLLYSNVFYNMNFQFGTLQKNIYFIYYIVNIYLRLCTLVYTLVYIYLCIMYMDCIYASANISWLCFIWYV